METSTGALGILFPLDIYQHRAQVVFDTLFGMCVKLCTGAYSVACDDSLSIHIRECASPNVCLHVCVSVCVYVLISVPPCFASVQKGLVPTTWCRAASAQPIPAWIATLRANQKLPAAFAVCPLSIFSHSSLNLLASLGCCINPPPLNILPYHKFLLFALRHFHTCIPLHYSMKNVQTKTVIKVASAYQGVIALLISLFEKIIEFKTSLVQKQVQTRPFLSHGAPHTLFLC